MLSTCLLICIIIIYVYNSPHFMFTPTKGNLRQNVLENDATSNQFFLLELYVINIVFYYWLANNIIFSNFFLNVFQKFLYLIF